MANFSKAPWWDPTQAIVLEEVIESMSGGLAS